MSRTPRPRQKVRTPALVLLGAGILMSVAQAAGNKAGDGEIVTSLQIPLPASASGGYGLDQAPTLIGTYGLSARDVLLALAPHLAAARLVPKSMQSGGGGDAVHEDYELWFGDYRLDDAYLSIHNHKNRLVFLRAKLPDYRLPAEPPTADDFIPLAALGFESAEREAAVKVLAASSGFPAPSWAWSQFDPARSVTVTRIIDAQTGAVLSETETFFGSAQVYEKSPADGHLIPVELPDLSATGFLDGKHFSVYAPNETDARVPVDGAKLDAVRPDDPTSPTAFDQVEAYYAATKALSWFKERFGYDIGATHLNVRVNDLVGGRAENAAYLPAPLGPEILIGKGGERMTGLARDTDVVIHEFSHHVIFGHVTTAAGESGVFHEGTADYFAYALNGDPYLAESIVPGAPFLRTAAQPAAARYDALSSKEDAHTKGQIWSAVLWELRQRLGAELGDKVVYESLAYMGPRSGFADAFHALLNADRDLAPLAGGDPEVGIFGRNKCAILNAGVARGFAYALDALGPVGAPCGLDLAVLAEQSRAVAKIANDNSPKTGQKVGITAFGKRCSTIPFSDNSSEGVTLLLWLLSLPVLVSLSSAIFPGATRGRDDDGP